MLVSLPAGRQVLIARAITVAALRGNYTLLQVLFYLIICIYKINKKNQTIALVHLHIKDLVNQLGM